MHQAKINVISCSAEHRRLTTASLSQPRYCLFFRHFLTRNIDEWRPNMQRINKTHKIRYIRSSFSLLIFYSFACLLFCITPITCIYSSPVTFSYYSSILLFYEYLVGIPSIYRSPSLYAIDGSELRRCWNYNERISFLFWLLHECSRAIYKACPRECDSVVLSEPEWLNLLLP